MLLRACCSAEFTFKVEDPEKTTFQELKHIFFRNGKEGRGPLEPEDGKMLQGNRISESQKQAGRMTRKLVILLTLPTLGKWATPLTS